jgi:hypothetical protein
VGQPRDLVAMKVPEFFKTLGQHRPTWQVSNYVNARLAAVDADLRRWSFERVDLSCAEQRRKRWRADLVLTRNLPAADAGLLLLAHFRPSAELRQGECADHPNDNERDAQFVEKGRAGHHAVNGPEPNHDAAHQSHHFDDPVRRPAGAAGQCVRIGIASHARHKMLQLAAGVYSK